MEVQNQPFSRHLRSHVVPRVSPPGGFSGTHGIHRRSTPGPVGAPTGAAGSPWCPGASQWEGLPLARRRDGGGGRGTVCEGQGHAEESGAWGAEELDGW